LFSGKKVGEDGTDIPVTKFLMAEKDLVEEMDKSAMGQFVSREGA